MFKKFLPALTLMFVFAIAFAGRPAEKNLAVRYYELQGGVWTQVFTPPTCPNGDFKCAIIINDDELDPEDAQNAADELTPQQVKDFPNGNEIIPGAQLVKRAVQ